MLCLSCPDLFHLSLCLSPPPSRCHPSSPLSPVYLYMCSLFVCCQFVLFRQAYQRFSLWSWRVIVPGFPDFYLSPHPEPFPHYSGLLISAWPDPEPACCPVPLPHYSGLLISVWPDPEPACCPVPLPHYSGLSTSACHELLFAWLCCCNKHCYFDTVCIWVLPSNLIIHLPNNLKLRHGFHFKISLFCQILQQLHSMSSTCEHLWQHSPGLLNPDQ
jgi:hypothetical protein